MKFVKNKKDLDERSNRQYSQYKQKKILLLIQRNEIFLPRETKGFNKKKVFLAAFCIDDTRGEVAF